MNIPGLGPLYIGGCPSVNLAVVQQLPSGGLPTMP